MIREELLALADELDEAGVSLDDEGNVVVRKIAERGA